MHDPAGGFPPPTDSAELNIHVADDGGLHVTTVVPWEQDDRIGPVTDAVAASLRTPGPASVDYPTLVSNQGSVSAPLTSSGAVVQVADLHLE